MEDTAASSTNRDCRRKLRSHSARHWSATVCVKEQALKRCPTLPHLPLGEKSEPTCIISGVAVIFWVHWDHPPAAKSIKIHNADG
ncbi:hypothetical protein BU25DRAFT_411840 [Macroventuria anomochaeta]|uniref:Uncharacterized protein n=1 Tax=Macroventuria anomochaeta TaxID=301207 RepID=A0ACB6RX29_9PLEO|nr:uncharacterized protein BU25DRAFT_411840 [Macroventuria anomochaeta]KAF2626446.1 hypothetical protein BU25DRAFT_411840 [Macroventuria anomochaeta]